MDFEKIIKENLRTIIRQRGVTQAWLAEKAETTEATVSRYLTGIHSPRIELIAKMATALNVSVDYLLGLSESSIRPCQSLSMLRLRATSRILTLSRVQMTNLRDE